jgi:hypothetical protein
MLFTVVLKLGSAKVSQGFGEILMKFGYLVCFCNYIYRFPIGLIILNY